MGDVQAKSTESKQPAQSHDLTRTEWMPPVPAAPDSTATPRRARSLRRVWTARLFAIAIDTVQIALLPLVLGGALSPVNDVLDVVTAVVLTVLVGWHWAFLPAFVAEVVPLVDLVPSWTLAVFIATRSRGEGPDLTRP